MNSISYFELQRKGTRELQKKKTLPDVKHKPEKASQIFPVYLNL